MLNPEIFHRLFSQDSHRCNAPISRIAASGEGADKGDGFREGVFVEMQAAVGPAVGAGRLVEVTRAAERGLELVGERKHCGMRP